MDDATHKELRAWLEFYQELGIEGFYRRDPVKSPISNLPSSAPVVEVPTRPDFTPPAPGVDRQGGGERSVPPNSPTRIPPQAKPPDSGHRTPDRMQGLQTPEARPVIRPPAPSFSLFEAAPVRRSGPETLEQIRQDLGDCRRCKLAPTRKTIVFGEGNPHAELVFIGEGPGADEDEQGLPFVGRAGKLLNRMMQTVGLKREDVYICNVVKCRPPGNRTPEKDEVDSCSPFLYRQIESIKPRLVCCLGAPAVRTVLGIKEGITKIRGQFYNFGAAKALATVHPAYVLRNPREEKILLEDFEKIRDFLKGV
jgi:DNA polymerase